MPLLYFVVFISFSAALFLQYGPIYAAAGSAKVPNPMLSSLKTGREAYQYGVKELRAKNYDNAAEALFLALVAKDGVKDKSPQEIMQLFWKCYSDRNILEKGYNYIARKYLMQGDHKAAQQNAEQSNKVTPNADAYIILAQSISQKLDAMARFKYTHKAIELAEEEENLEAMMDAANIFYEDKFLGKSLETYEKILSIKPDHLAALANSIYMRSNTFNWRNITHYEKCMKQLESIVDQESITNMLKTDSIEQQSAVHPHMTLGYDIDPMAKLLVAQAHARAEKVLVTNAKLQIIDHTQFLDKFRDETLRDGFRIKLGYVSANFKTKATIYLAQDMFQFHDRNKFEVHVYATTPNDSPQYLQQAMRGVDWRQKIEDSVEFFHDLSGQDVARISQQIMADGIHILFNWDGYSNNGVRPTGLFPIQSAPLQVVHLEYVGTMGADYIQYAITDKIATPMSHESYYSEKFVYMPHSFFANSFPYQRPDMFDPVYDTDWNAVKDIFSQFSINIEDSDIFDLTSPLTPFIYCQFNKHLKISPVVFTEWLKVLQATENTILLLLENPTESIAFFEAFVRSFDPSLINRVFFAKFINNPYDNQFRVSRVCNVVLDNPTYNSHTTAVDALWGGTPIVTLGGDRHMAGRVVESILSAIGIPELIAYNYNEFVSIAARLSQERAFYLATRKRLVDENMKSVHNLTLVEQYENEDEEKGIDINDINYNSVSNGRKFVLPNRYWDLKQYVRDMEIGLTKIWDYFLETGSYKHFSVNDGDGDDVTKLDNTGSDSDMSAFKHRQNSDSKSDHPTDMSIKTEASALQDESNSSNTGSSDSVISGRSGCLRVRSRPAFARKYYYRL